MFRQRHAGPDVWTVAALAASAAAGAGAVAYGVLRGMRVLERRQQRTWSALDRLEDEAVEVLRRDSVTGVCAIDVAALGPHTIELTGVVPTHEVAQRAARLLHALPGVATVISRLEMGSFEARLAENRDRLASGASSSTQRRWYGVRVGTGRRRQSVETEPERPDDTVERRTRALEVQSSDVADAASPEPERDAFGSSQPPL
jgi:hypothetical protein